MTRVYDYNGTKSEGSTACKYFPTPEPICEYYRFLFHKYVASWPSLSVIPATRTILRQGVIK